jgi:hypothetical protein
MYQHLPLQDPPKFTQIGIFGLKICHLATLVIFSQKCIRLKSVYKAQLTFQLRHCYIWFQSSFIDHFCLALILNLENKDCPLTNKKLNHARARLHRVVNDCVIFKNVLPEKDLTLDPILRLLNLSTYNKNAIWCGRGAGTSFLCPKATGETKNSSIVVGYVERIFKVKNIMLDSKWTRLLKAL